MPMLPPGPPTENIGGDSGFVGLPMGEGGITGKGCLPGKGNGLIGCPIGAGIGIGCLFGKGKPFVLLIFVREPITMMPLLGFEKHPSFHTLSSCLCPYLL